MTPKHQTGLLFVYYITNLNLLEYFFKLKIYTVFRDILSICQLHILLSRTAQFFLELHFCVELHAKNRCCGLQALLDRCFTDIEQFVLRVQQAADAYKELDNRRSVRVNKHSKYSGGKL